MNLYCLTRCQHLPVDAMGMGTGENSLHSQFQEIVDYILCRRQELEWPMLRAALPGSKLVQAVLDYFRTEPFYYTRNAPLLYDDPVDTFLFDTRRGFCEHYASAFTVMMRQADDGYRQSETTERRQHHE